MFLNTLIKIKIKESGRITIISKIAQKPELVFGNFRNCSDRDVRKRSTRGVRAKITEVEVRIEREGYSCHSRKKKQEREA